MSSEDGRAAQCVETRRQSPPALEEVRLPAAPGEVMGCGGLLNTVTIYVAVPALFRVKTTLYFLLRHCAHGQCMCGASSNCILICNASIQDIITMHVYFNVYLAADLFQQACPPQRSRSQRIGTPPEITPRRRARS